MTIGQLVSFEPMKSAIEVPCGITAGRSESPHLTNKYMFVRLLPETHLAQDGSGQNTERSAAEVKICPPCFDQLLYKMTQAAKESFTT